MRPILYTSILVILFLAACTPDERLSPDGAENVTFLFTAGSQTGGTRTVLNSSKNLQHVERVYLYIFNGLDDTATCADSRELAWPSPADVDYKTTQRLYSITLAPGKYTFLAIGLDDKSGATYDLPAAVAVGSTLADAKATLASEKTGEDIAQSEFFAGYATASVKEKGNDKITINLWRRVAGVMGWFTNIPSNTSKIQVCLYAPQNGSGYLLKQEPAGNGDLTEPANFKDYITSPVGATEQDKILISIDVPPGTNEATILSGGSYMLPAATPLKGNGLEYTLCVKLTTTDGSPGKIVRVRMSDTSDLYIPEFDWGGTGAGGMDMGGPYRYPIVANRFYGIGTESAPADLGGDNLVITVNPNWETIYDIPLKPSANEAQR